MFNSIIPLLAATIFFSVLFPVTVGAQTCGNGAQKYTISISSEGRYDSPAESCKAWDDGHAGDLVGIEIEPKLGSTGAVADLDYVCIMNNSGNITRVFGGAVCNIGTSGDDWVSGFCKPEDDCFCSKNSSCCMSGGGGAGGGSGGSGGGGAGGGSGGSGSAGSGSGGSGGGGFGGGFGGGSASGQNGYSVGNPMSIPWGYKNQIDTDWVSVKDSRFYISRIYLSGGYSPYTAFLGSGDFDGGNGAPWASGFGLGWTGNWGYKLLIPNNQSNVYTVLAPGGKQYVYEGTGQNMNGRSDEPWSFSLPGGSHPNHFLWEDGSGLIVRFLDDSTGLAKLSSVEWSDGYTLSFTYDSNGRMRSMTDTRGQRAVFNWNDTINPSASVHVISRINVDTDYNGSAFNPDIRIDYTNTYDAGWPTGLIFSNAKLTDVSSSSVLAESEYSYDLTNVFTDIPMLTGISDTRLDQNNQPFDYATFDYDTSTFDGEIQTFRATESSHFNGADKYELATISSSPSPGGNYRTTNPLGKETTYKFGLTGGVKRPVEINGVASANCWATTKSLGYDPNPLPGGGFAPEGYVYERVERNGSKIIYERDADGLLTTLTEDADGPSPRVTTYTWHQTLRLPLSRETSELKELFSYDAAGILLSYTQEDVLSGSPSNGDTRVWTYTYDTTTIPGQKLLESIDGPGLASNGVLDITTFEYFDDGTALDGSLKKVIDPNGLETQFSNHDVFGNAGTITLPDGVEWDLTYDAVGRLLEAVDAANVNQLNTHTFVYDIVGLITSYTNGKGNTWSFDWDEARRLSEIETPDGETARYAYDAMGNVTSVEFANVTGTVLFEESSAFDELGRLMEVIGSNNQLTGFGYDVEDNLTDITDVDNNVIQNNWDALNRLISIVDRESETTELTYNDADQITDYEDARQNSTVFSYNGFGEVILEVSPDSGQIAYDYDERGLPTSMIDARGIETTYEYDNGGRITARKFVGHASEDQTFLYDTVTAGNGKLRRITDESGQIFRTYNSTGRLLRDQQTIEDAVYDVFYRYNNFGDLIRVETPNEDAGGLWIRHFLDDQNRLEKITVQRRNVSPLPGQQNVVYLAKYAPFGPLTSMRYGDNATNNIRTYDTSYRLTGLQDSKSGTQYRDVSYGWTDRDNLASATDTLASANNESFGYSPRERLAQAVGDYGTYNYTYDATGNRLSKQLVNTSTESFVYPSDSNNLTRINVTGSSPNGPAIYTHDASGNVIAVFQNGQTHSYTYNAAGRMVTYSIDGNLQAEYVYNALGQQVIRRLIQSGQTIHNVFDIDGNRLAEYDYDPSTQASTLLREYIWMDGELVGVAEPGSGNGTISFVRTDQIGRPVFATQDSSMNKVWEASYLPFGGVHVSNGSLIDLRFPGQWFNSESGLYQNWMRDYDPVTGRYLQADPLGLVDGAAIYNYARQSPENYFDFEGAAPKKKRSKYVKPPNPNKKKGADSRQKSGARERNVGHVSGEEHSIRPKGGNQFRFPGPLLFLPNNIFNDPRIICVQCSIPGACNAT